MQCAVFDLFEFLEAFPNLFRRVTNLVRISGTKDGKRTIVGGSDGKAIANPRQAGKKQKTSHFGARLHGIAKESLLCITCRAAALIINQ